MALEEFKNSVLKNGVHYVTSTYGQRTLGGNTSFHYGIDIVGFANGYTTLDYIVAFADGEVEDLLNSCNGKEPSQGNFVTINHGNGYKTVYYHLKQGSVCVAIGKKVQKGDVIGYMGSTGNSTGGHLHFGVQHKGLWEDPKPYLLGEKSFEEEKQTEQTTIVSGKEYKVNNAPYYANSSTDKVANTKSGTIYAWDNVVINNRFKFTVKSEWVGVSGCVTGWMNVTSVIGADTIADEYYTHTVVKGDTLWGIAKHYLGSGLKYTEIMKYNGMKTPIIHVGDEIKIKK